MDANLKELYDRGGELYNEGKYSEAEGLLREVNRLNPNYADVLNKLGVMASIKGDNEQAVLYFKRALELNPAYTEASLNLAITYNDMGDFEGAKDVFEIASTIASSAPGKLDPFAAGKLANEHYKIGNLYLDFGMFDEAMDEYMKALKLRPTLADVHTKLGIALRSKDRFEDAIVHFTKAKESNPHYGPAWVQLGLTYHMRGLTGLAHQEWEKALEINPDLREAKAYLNLLKKSE